MPALGAKRDTPGWRECREWTHSGHRPRSRTEVSMRSLGGDEPRTRRWARPYRNLRWTKPLAVSSSEGDFQLGRISTRDDGARETQCSALAYTRRQWTASGWRARRWRGWRRDAPLQLSDAGTRVPQPGIPNTVTAIRFLTNLGEIRYA